MFEALTKSVTERKSVFGGMEKFLVIWIGQVISIIGSGLTSFALGVWVYQETGSASQYALILLSFAIPNLLFSPVAGAIADRWDRRKVMILSDSGAALSTLFIALLLAAGRLEPWHIYLSAALNSTFGVFQHPAYTAATTMIVPKKHLARASGLTQMGRAISQIAAPMLAGILIGKIRIQGVILVDFLTFFFAVGALLLVRIPHPEPTTEEAETERSMWKDASFGWAYLMKRPGLMGLLSMFALVNFSMGMVSALFTPMVLSFSSADSLGLILSIGGVGMLVGSLTMSAWGGPKRRIYGLLGFILLAGLFTMVTGFRASALLIAAGSFGLFFCVPLANGCSQAIWQTKVAPDVQGRVFAARSMAAMSAQPIAYILAGPLADRVFVPLLRTDGILAGTLGRLIGTGPGRGMGLMFIILGSTIVLTAIAGYAYPRIRKVEDELPDTMVRDDAQTN